MLNFPKTDFYGNHNVKYKKDPLCSHTNTYIHIMIKAPKILIRSFCVLLNFEVFIKMCCSRLFPHLPAADSGSRRSRKGRGGAEKR